MAAVDPAVGGRSRWHDQRCFGRLVQEDQRLKKHDGRWMDIVWLLELESFILTKLTKPSIPVNFVGPQVIFPLWWVPASRGYSFFLCLIRRHFLACEDIAGGSDMSVGGTFFREIQRPFRWVPAVRSSQKKGKKIKYLGRRTEQASVPAKRRCLFLEKRKTCSCSWFESKPRL